MPEVFKPISDRTQSRIILALLSTMLFAVFVYGGATRATWYDEAMTVSVLSEAAVPGELSGLITVAELKPYMAMDSSPSGVLEELIERDVHPFFYFLMTDTWTQVFGGSLMTVRLLSATLAILAILVFHRMVTAAGLQGPLVYTGVFATSFLLTYTAVDARSGSQVILLSAIAFHLYLAGNRSYACEKQAKVSNEIGLGFAAAGLVLTHYFAAFLAVPLMISRGLRFLVSQKPVHLVAPICALLLVLPWARVAFQHLGARPGQGNGFEGLLTWSKLAMGQVSHLLVSYTDPVTPDVLVLGGQILVLAGLAATALWIGRHLLRKGAIPTGITSSSAIFSVIGLLLFTVLLLGTDKWTTELRYFAVFLVPITVLVVFGLMKLGEAISSAAERSGMALIPKLTYLPVGLIFTLQVATLNFGQEKIAGGQGHYWKSISSGVAEVGPGSALVIIDPGIGPGNIIAAAIELSPDTRLFILPEEPADWKGSTEQIARAALEADAVWLTYTITRTYEMARENGIYKPIIDRLNSEDFSPRADLSADQKTRFAAWIRRS